MLTVPQLLHNTIRDLHLIQETSDPEVLRNLLQKCLADIFILLNIDTVRKHDVLLSTNAFPTLNVVFHLSSNDSPQEPELSYANICNYIEEKVHDVTPSSVYTELLSLLADSAKGERRPVRIKEAYSIIVSRFAKLLLYIIQLNVAAENALLEFLSNCFVLEQSFYASIKSHIDVIPDEDTERIIGALDSFIEKPDVDITAALLDSIFSYDDISPKQESSEALEFRSSDTNFNNLYAKFLHLSLFKPPDSFRESSNAYLKVMLNLYKRSVYAKYIEIQEVNPVQKKIDVLKDFFFGTGEESGILPYKHSALVSEIIDKIGSQHQGTKIALNSFIPETTFTASLVDASGTRFDLLTDEAVDLISQVSAVFESISESGIALDPFYPSIFRQYLINVYEKMPEMVSPKDSNYIRTVANTIQAIVDYKEDGSADEQSVLVSLIRDLHGVQNSLIEAHPQLSILMRLAVGEHLRTRASLVRTLRNWDLKLLKIRQMEMLCQENYPKSNKPKLIKTHFSKWYRNASRNRDLYKHAAIYSDRQTLTRFFDKFLIKPLIVISQRETQADKYFCRVYLRKWASRYQKLKNSEADVAWNVSQDLLRGTFAKILEHYEKRLDRMSLATQFRENAIVKQERLLLMISFHLWTNKLVAKYLDNGDSRELGHMFEQLNLSARVLGVRKLFEMWSKTTELKRSARAFERVKKHIVLKASFCKWNEAHDLTKLEKNYIREKNVTSKRSALAHWISVCNRHIAANQMYRRELLRSHFKSLRMRYAENLLNFLRDGMILKLFFTKWVLSRALIESCDSRVGEMFGVWQLKAKKIKSKHFQAGVFYDQKIKRQAFNAWYDYLSLAENQHEIAELNFQRNMFNRITRRLYQRQLHEQRAATHFFEVQKSQEQILVQESFKKWETKYNQLFEAKSQVAIENFTKEVTEKRILLLKLRQWFKKHRQLVERKNNLREQLERFQNTSYNVRSKLDQWINATNSRFDLVEQADEFYIGSMYVKYWRIWLEKYIRIVNFMNVEADNLADRKDYESAVAILRKWYYKYATITSATENICKTFLEKKRRVNLRIMFELWMYKIRSKRPDYMLDAYGEANSSFGSNASPLAGKNSDIKSAGSFLGNETYFYSPIGASSPYTPVKHKTSPTRLQETNQRLKLHRMDALTRRFRNANFLDEKRQASLHNEPFPKLSPPKRASNTTMKQPPPPPPNFGDFQYDSESGSVYNRDSSSPSEVDKDEQSLIETAKSLRRIRPIAIPFEESPGGIRYSTLHSLKDRLQSAQFSPKRSQ